MAATSTSGFTLSLVPLVAAALIAPGYIISFVSSRFTMGRANFSAGLLALSSVYYSTVWLIAGILWDIKSMGQVIEEIKDINFYSVFAVVALIPAIVGILSGIAIQRKWIYDLIRWKRIPKWLRPNPIIGTPSAWDFRFLDSKTQWITVHLEDGSEITALYEAGCFVSTDPNERDIYLQKIHKWKKDGENMPIAKIDGILLTGNSIRKIEFHTPKPSEKEKEDE